MDTDEIYAEDIDWPDTARALQQEVTRLLAENNQLRAVATAARDWVAASTPPLGDYLGANKALHDTVRALGESA